MNLQRAVFRSFLYRISLFLTVTLLLFFLYALLPEDLKIIAFIAASAPDQKIFEAMALEETGFFSFFGQLLCNPSVRADFLYHGLASVRLSLSALPLIFLTAGLFLFFRARFRNFYLIILGLSSFPVFFAGLLLSGLSDLVTLSAALILGFSVVSAIYRGPPEWYPLSFSFTATLLALELVFGIEGFGWWMYRSAMRLDFMPLFLVIPAVSAGICLFRFITDLYTLYGRSGKKESFIFPQKAFPELYRKIHPAALFIVFSAAALTFLIPGASLVFLTSFPAAAAGMATGLLFAFLVRGSGEKGRKISIWIADVMLSIPPVPVAFLLFVLSGGAGYGLFFLLMVLTGWPRYFKGSLNEFRLRELLSLLFHHAGDLLLLVALLAFAEVLGGPVTSHWGGMIGKASNWSGLVPADDYTFTGTVLLPGTGIFLTVFSWNLIGRALAFRKKINTETAQPGEPC